MGAIKRIITSVLFFVGYYSIKKRLKQKLFLKRIKREDEKKKIDIADKIFELPENLLKKNGDSADIIVSLTSYGKRLYDSAPYAIYSLFTQSLLPNRICLFLDDSWNDEKLPELIKRLMKSGLEVYYGEDIKSYKKLIPALKKFPDNPIITVDDDFYYNRETVEMLLKAYSTSDKKTVLGTWARAEKSENGFFLPYNEWEDCRNLNGENYKWSLMAGNGTLYPPHIFDNEICNSNVFMNFAPTADDIWFWAMERRQNIRVVLISKKGCELHTPVNRSDVYDTLQSRSTLCYANDIIGKNNEQCDALVQRYYLRPIGIQEYSY